MIGDKIKIFCNKFSEFMNSKDQEEKMDINELINDKEQLVLYNTFRYTENNNEYDINIYIQKEGYTEEIKKQIYSIIQEGFDNIVNYKHIFNIVSLVAPKNTILRIAVRQKSNIDIMILQAYRVY